MNLQENKSLTEIYNREEDFSADLAENLDALKVGKFEDAETEASVGTRRADIVATGEDGTLVVECQFNKADWDHWGRLEAYSRLKEADVAALVAEDFEELMIVTCNLRNEDSNVNWFLIQAQVNSHDELYFNHVARPAIDIQSERKADAGYSEFWQPIRDGDFGDLFTGRLVPIRDDGWIMKTLRNIQVCLFLNNYKCYIRLYFLTPNHLERRDKVMELFSDTDYDFEQKDTSTQTTVIFPVIDKGRNNYDDWDEIREKLVTMGTDIYNKIDESGL